MIEGMGLGKVKEVKEIKIEKPSGLEQFKDDVLAMIRGLFKGKDEKVISKSDIEMGSIDPMREVVKFESNFDEVGDKTVQKDEGLDKAVNLLRGGK